MGEVVGGVMRAESLAANFLTSSLRMRGDSRASGTYYPMNKNISPMNFIQEHLRRIVIVGALFIALLGALGLAGISQQSTKYWALSHDLQIGEKISQSDLVKVDANLGGAGSRYLDATKPVMNKVATRMLSTGELLPLNAIGVSAQASNLRELSLGILNSDLPADLSVGDLVDIYLVPRDPQSQSEKVATKLLVVGVDARSRNLGGSINVLLSIKEADVLNVTDALTLGRLLVVRNAR